MLPHLQLVEKSAAILCVKKVVHMPVVCNYRCRVVHTQCRKLGEFFRSCSTRQGRRYPCGEAEAVSHGPDCSAGHGDSAVALGQGA